MIKILANQYPSLFSGLWFGTAALICCSPLAIMFFLNILLDSITYSAAFLQFSVIPLIAGFVTGATVGSVILKSNQISSVQSFFIGGVVTVMSIFLWGIMGGILFKLWSYLNLMPVCQDTPGAAYALAETSFMTIVMLLIILAVISFGCLVGMSLFSYNENHGNRS